MNKGKGYTSYNNDSLYGNQMVVKRTTYFDESTADISNLIKLPLEKLNEMKDKSLNKGREIFECLRDRAQEWEKQSGTTVLIEKAIEYVRTANIKHSNNKWIKDDVYGLFEISNPVYAMRYRTYEYTHYDREKRESVPYKWTVSWSVVTNSPSRNNRVIAGQDRKAFKSKEAMNKYIDGRIKAYQHLFTEISQIVPKEYADCFKVNGCLLPGYVVEE